MEHHDRNATNVPPADGGDPGPEQWLRSSAAILLSLLEGPESAYHRATVRGLTRPLMELASLVFEVGRLSPSPGGDGGDPAIEALPRGLTATWHR